MTASPPTSRVVAVLEALAETEEGITASTLARGLGLSTSTLSLILGTLNELDYVERMPDRSYRLGVGVMRLLNGMRHRYPMLGTANDELGRLSEMFSCSCALARLGPNGQEVVLTAGRTEELGIKPGVSLPLDPPHGTIAMAWRSPAEIDRWLSHSPGDLEPENEKAQRDALFNVRQHGFAVYGIRKDAGSMIGQLRELLRAVQSAESDQALHRQLDQLAMVVGTRIYSVEELSSRKRRGVSHIIAPVFGPDSQPRYLVSLHVMRDSVSPESLDRCIEELLRSAEALTLHIGGRRPIPSKQ